MKILSKIARRHGGDELPDRRELVEMDLFDTDRNPWTPEGSGGDEYWSRHDYDFATPFYARLDASGFAEFGEQDLERDLVVEHTSFALAFVGGIFNVHSGANSQYQTANIQLQATGPNNWGNLAAATHGNSFLSNADGYRTRYDEGWGYAVLGPGTYKVRVWCYVQHTQANFPAVEFTEMAATIALLDLGVLTPAWGGILG